MSELIKCDWCQEEHQAKEMDYIHSAEFMGGKRPICKSCDEKYFE